MQRRKQVSRRALARSIEWAKQLVEGHTDSPVSVGERLRDIGKRLNVSRIEAGAVRTDGFLKRLADGSFAIYYADDCSLARRRFTVAHEIAHLVLERFHRHLGHGHPVAGRDGHASDIERVVDRIAAEILMPESVVIGLMRKHCQLQREQSSIGVVQKREVIVAVGQSVGVSERAIVHRLLELPDLLSVLLRFRWRTSEGPGRARHFPVVHSQHGYLRIVDGLSPDPSELDNEAGCEHQLHVQTKWGLRMMRCHGWRRSASCTLPGHAEAWILGWTWNSFPLFSWDDSEHRGGTVDVSRVREFERALARRGK